MNREVSGMMFSYISKSQYHDTCVPANKRQPAQPALAKPHPTIDYTKCNQVAEDQIWKKSVSTEQKAAKKWENNWQFLTEYDSQGNPIEKEPLPEKASLYNEGTVPITNAGQYGARVHSEHSQTIFSLEQALSAPNRKKKLNSDFVCY